MGGEALTALPRDLHRLSVKPPVVCSFDALALLLSRLLQRPLTAAAVQDRAVGLGLLRLSGAGAPGRLSPERASRLFLAGYQLPALAERATLTAAREHLAARRHVFLILGEAEPPVVQLQALLPDDGPAWALVGACAAEGHAIEEVAAEWLLGAWEAAGRVIVAAARRWEDLPAAAGRFFGGTRENDGSYHWDGADCDTDASGHILRCW
ncbi:MAG TPA: hypothetical protein VKA46_09345 [Gemmataceae bacterium]|nr:hypothetical protein [Gemmataceae bacterium]